MDMQPGQLIVPHDDESSKTTAQQPAAGAPPEPQRPDEQPLPQAPAPSPPVEQTTTLQSFGYSPTASRSPQAQAISSQGTWAADDRYGGQSTEPGQPTDELSWTAAEFTGHQKSAAWYGLVIIGGLVLAGLYYWIARDVIFTAVIVMVLIMAIIYASHKPRSEAYHLSPQGLQIGNRLYGFQQFKNFSVTDESSVASVILAPLGRIALPVTISVPPDIEDKVLDYLSFFLPFEEHRNDAVDGLLRRIRF